MNDKIAQLRKNFKNMVGVQPNLPIDGVVTAIENDTCKVRIGDFEVSDVRLKAIANSTDSLLLVPVVGSEVLMLSTDGSVGNLTIIKCDKVSKFIYKENGLVVEINSEDGKVNIQNESVSLKGLFEDLTNILKQFKVFTPSGVSGTPIPNVIQKLNQFETDFKNLLK